MFARAQTRRVGAMESRLLSRYSKDVQLRAAPDSYQMGWILIEGAASLLLG
jgi:hypothetical protein